jgi:hypothetical protein
MAFLARNLPLVQAFRIAKELIRMLLWSPPNFLYSPAFRTGTLLRNCFKLERSIRLLS